MLLLLLKVGKKNEVLFFFSPPPSFSPPFFFGFDGKVCVGHERDYKKKGKKERNQRRNKLSRQSFCSNSFERERLFFWMTTTTFISTYARLRGRKTYRRGEREREEKKE